MTLPNNSPFAIPPLMCSSCGSMMRPEVQKVGKGMIQGVVAYCDECKYGWNVSLQYAVGTNAPYKPKMPKTEEVVKFDPRATATKTAEGGQ